MDATHPQRDDFIRRALDVVFRGRAWCFFVQSKPAWQIEDGSKVLQRLRITAAVAERFSWVSGPLIECLFLCARRNLRASVTDEFSVKSAMQPRAGYYLSRASSWSAQTSQLRAAASLSAAVDARLRTRKVACRLSDMPIIVIDRSHFGRLWCGVWCVCGRSWVPRTQGAHALSGASATTFHKVSEVHWVCRTRPHCKLLGQ